MYELLYILSSRYVYKPCENIAQISFLFKFCHLRITNEQGNLIYTLLCKSNPITSLLESNTIPQVGNAVPPPMARAIGLEIRKCLAARNDKDQKSKFEGKMEVE